MRIYECKYTNQISKVLTNAKKGYFCQFKRTYALEVDGKIYGVVMNIFERIWATFLKVFGTDVIKNKFGRKKIKQATVKDLKIGEEQLLRILKMLLPPEFLEMKRIKMIAKQTLNLLHDENVQREFKPNFNPEEDPHCIDLLRINNRLKQRGLEKVNKTEFEMALRYLLMQGKILWKIEGGNCTLVGIKEPLDCPPGASTAEKLIAINHQFIDVEKAKTLLPAEKLSQDTLFNEKKKTDLEFEIAIHVNKLNEHIYNKGLGAVTPECAITSTDSNRYDIRNFMVSLRNQGIINSCVYDGNRFLVDL
jgi:hypothetical protein